MAAARKNQGLGSFPVVHGMLRANAQTIEGPRASDGCDVFIDSRGNLVGLLLDLRSAGEAHERLLAELMREARAGLQRFEPLHVVVNALEVQLSVRPGLEAGLVILRMSQRDARVEVLNAGMPAVAHAGDARLDLYPALSGSVGQRLGEVHPYELVPLVWGATWLSVSDGLTGGSLDDAVVKALCSQLDLAHHGLELACKTAENFLVSLEGLHGSLHFRREDASAIVLATDPSARFQSGINHT